MFYFVETNTGSQIALESLEVKIMWQEGTGTKIFGKKANRVYSSAESIATIYARNAPQDMILVTDTLSSLKVVIPLYAIKDIRPYNGHSIVYYGETKIKQQEVNETVTQIVNAIAASVAGPTVNGFERDPNALTNPALYHSIRINLSNGSYYSLDLAPILGSTENTMYVSKNGDDALALAAGGYNQHQPWKNPTVAMAAAVAGDTVVVMPGVYTIGDVGGEDISDDGNQQMVRSEVVLYMLPGAEIQYTNLTGTFSLPFTDGGVASRFIIRGKGKFKFNRNITGGDTFQLCTNAGTTVDWECDTIDTRRRFGTTGHNCVLFRMVGKDFINRESQMAALRYPAAAANRIGHIKFERTTFGAESANNQWTRLEVRNLGVNSNFYIDLGEVIYPNAFTLGGLFQKTNCGTSAKVDFYANSVIRVNNGAIRDYLVVGTSDGSGGIVDIKNINTPTGLCLYTGAGSISTVKKTETYQGVVRAGYSGGAVNLQVFVGMASCVQSNLDILVESLSASYFGVEMLSSPKVAISGKVIWHNTTNEPIRLSAGGTGVGSLENLILSELDPAVASVLNVDPAPRNIKVMNTFATTAVSLANGGVVQLVGIILVNSNV